MTKPSPFKWFKTSPEIIRPFVVTRERALCILDHLESDQVTLDVRQERDATPMKTPVQR
ncbi:hypothetical protein R5H32_16160 [Defluviimonas sp. D31]|uniref:hypothetical protein n=1 Tax=Defluviimonas sp. D31 TaxID=3083253 RepID=UPI00296EAB1D|nr:hypothetical protein [Defluviimonas sp. D31]MDW4550896.1 hypothetical protein [Defluviimonas sp. D31]